MADVHFSGRLSEKYAPSADIKKEHASRAAQLMSSLNALMTPKN